MWVQDEELECLDKEALVATAGAALRVLQELQEDGALPASALVADLDAVCLRHGVPVRRALSSAQPTGDDR